MKRIQKLAIFMFVVLSISFIVTAAGVGFLYLKFGFAKAQAGIGFLGLAGIAGLGPLIFKKGPDKIDRDERDVEIQRRAALAGFGAAYLVVGLATMVPFMMLGSKATIEVRWLPLIFMGAGLANFYVWSIAILSQYGWKS